MTHTPETQCPGCGTTFVGKSGFASAYGEFPSKNAMSCPVHRAAPALLEALADFMSDDILRDSSTWKAARGKGSDAMQAAQ